MADQKCALVTILGAPNAGKSTLLNYIIGNKISIVSPKVQTTRGKVRGIYIQDTTQLVLIDTAGIFKPSRRLDRAMVSSAWNEAQEADFRLFLIDAKKGLDANTKLILQHLIQFKQKAILVFNKIDQVSSAKLVQTTDAELKNNNSILADVCEAVLGALYLDKGLNEVVSTVR